MKMTKESLLKVIGAADDVISALAGTNDEVHKDDTDKMVRLWDDLNDQYAPPEVVRELARLALAAMDSEPAAPVAEVVSIYGDHEAFGEREIRPLVGIQQMPYGTKLYRHAQQPVVESEPVAEVLSNRPGNDTSTIDRALPVGTQLYRHAQTAPVVPDRYIFEVNVGGNTWVQCSEKAFENAKSKGELTRVLYEHPSAAVFLKD